MKKEIKKNASPKEIKQVKNRGKDFYYYKHYSQKDNKSLPKGNKILTILSGIFKKNQATTNKGLAALAEILKTNNQTISWKINGKIKKYKDSRPYFRKQLTFSIEKTIVITSKEN